MAESPYSLYRSRESGGRRDRERVPDPLESQEATGVRRFTNTELTPRKSARRLASELLTEKDHCVASVGQNEHHRPFIFLLLEQNRVANADPMHPRRVGREVLSDQVAQVATACPAGRPTVEKGGEEKCSKRPKWLRDRQGLLDPPRDSRDCCDRDEEQHRAPQLKRFATRTPGVRLAPVWSEAHPWSRRGAATCPGPT